MGLVVLGSHRLGATYQLDPMQRLRGRESANVAHEQKEQRALQQSQPSTASSGRNLSLARSPTATYIIIFLGSVIVLRDVGPTGLRG